jgi:DNA-binding response OmpR family regulator
MNTSKSPLRALIADGDRPVRQLIRSALERLGHQGDECDCPVALYEKVESGTYPLLILDSQLGGVDGLRILSSLRTNKIGIPAIYMTRKLPLKAEVTWCLTTRILVLLKPFTIAQMIQAIRGMAATPA